MCGFQALRGWRLWGARGDFLRVLKALAFQDQYSTAEADTVSSSPLLRGNRGGAVALALAARVEFGSLSSTLRLAHFIMAGFTPRRALLAHPDEGVWAYVFIAVLAFVPFQELAEGCATVAHADLVPSKQRSNDPSPDCLAGV